MRKYPLLAKGTKIGKLQILKVTVIQSHATYTLKCKCGYEFNCRENRLYDKKLEECKLCKPVPRKKIEKQIKQKRVMSDNLSDILKKIDKLPKDKFKLILATLAGRGLDKYINRNPKIKTVLGPDEDSLESMLCDAYNLVVECKPEHMDYDLQLFRQDNFQIHLSSHSPLANVVPLDKQRL